MRKATFQDAKSHVLKAERIPFEIVIIAVPPKIIPQRVF